MKYYLKEENTSKSLDNKQKNKKISLRTDLLKEKATRSTKYTNISFNNKRSSSGSKLLKPRKQRSIFKNIRKIIYLVVILIVGLVAYKVSDSILNNKALNLNPLELVKNQILNQDKPLNSTNGIVSILLLGGDSRGGNGLSYDLSQVGNTDVILILSYDTKTNIAHLISLPRDMGIKFEFPNNVTYKINKITSGVTLGVSGNYPGGGSQLMRDTILKITGIKINYTVVVDFKALVQVIDSIGGVDINIENSFCDSGYPTDNGDGSTIKIIFHKGLQHMDGKTSLEFARSRVHNLCSDFTAGDPIFEGTDFRRNYRQQQVISAIKSKIAISNLTLEKILGIYSALNNHIITEVGDGEFNESKRIDLSTIKTAVDNLKTYEGAQLDSFVINPNACAGKLAKEGYVDYTYYLLPIEFNFGNLKDCTSFYFQHPGLGKEQAITAIYNISDINTKAQNIKDELNTDYMSADYYGNLFTKTAKSADGKTTLDLTKGNIICDWYSSNPITLNYLANKYNAKIVKKEQLSGSIHYLSGADLLLIIGNPIVNTSSSTTSLNPTSN